MSSAVLTALLFAAVQASPPQQQNGPVPTAEAVAADTGAMRHANHRTPPLVHAARITAGNGVRLDGRLDEAIWSQARPASQFSQTQPHEGQPATERSDVRVLYDEHAVYVGAKLYD